MLKPFTSLMADRVIFLFKSLNLYLSIIFNVERRVQVIRRFSTPRKGQNFLIVNWLKH